MLSSIWILCVSLQYESARMRIAAYLHYNKYIWDVYMASLFYKILISMKTATTIEEQIAILKQRGMKIENERKAKENLLDIGYYRFGFYSFPFEKTYPALVGRDHCFKDGTSFEIVRDLYYFDQDLRYILSRYLYRIEINIRTFVSYTVSNKYRSNPFWFADSRAVDSKFLSQLPQIYSDISKNNAIKNHHAKYINDKYAPAWKTLEYMTFGNVIMLYTYLKDTQIKEDIAKHYGIENVNVFENYMNTARVVRNLCAHAHNIYDLKLQKGISKGPIKNFTGSYRHNICGVLLVLVFLLRHISNNRMNDLIEEVRRLLCGSNQLRVIDCVRELDDFVKKYFWRTI